MITRRGTRVPGPRPTAARDRRTPASGVAAALALATTVALSGCVQGSPGDGPTTDAPGPARLVPTPDAPPAGSTPLPGWTWENGAPIHAVPTRFPNAKVPQGRPAKLPSADEWSASWDIATSDGTLIGLVHRRDAGGQSTPQLSLVRGGRATPALPRDSGDVFSERGQDGVPRWTPVPGTLSPSGQGFLFMAASTVYGDDAVTGTVRLYRVNRVGDPARLVSEWAVPEDEPLVMGGVTTGLSDGGRRIYWDQGTLGANWDTQVMSVPLTGGRLQLEAEHAAAPMPTAQGLFALSLTPGTGRERSLAFGTVADGAVVPVLRFTRPVDDGVPRSISSDGERVALADVDLDTDRGYHGAAVIDLRSGRANAVSELRANAISWNGAVYIDEEGLIRRLGARSTTIADFSGEDAEGWGKLTAGWASDGEMSLLWSAEGTAWTARVQME